MPTAPPGALRTIRGTQPGLLDPSQPSRLLHFPDANLHFTSFDPKTALVDRQEPDMRKLNIPDILPPPKRVEGTQDKGFWPRPVILNGEQVHCYQEQWEIYKLDPAYRCPVFGGNKLSSITRVSLEDPSSSALDPSGVKRSRSTSPDPAPQKRVRSCYAQSSTSDDSDGIEDSEEDEIEDMLVDEVDGSEMPKFTSNCKFGPVDRELLNAERQWRWRMNRVVQDKYNAAPPLPTGASFSMQDARSDSYHPT
ncbi:hypothetical protein BKA82DRAFT_28842 [Pisolithus tinctorius]|uniref:Uncharacterized protein n=1 Tax=Pisolithus tinctorius Marx 270 TaxID=870435 RepID=A0A0C3JV32_PISTI|nr:hypothetical protein BKA82DRAFT_28842 [Pisolithus tinctorius]KIO01302.1 hypothetical protein M404DRAFT_28842 [Pisolithus tinctorius Marx 270]